MVALVPLGPDEQVPEINKPSSPVLIKPRSAASYSQGDMKARRHINRLKTTKLVISFILLGKSRDW